MTVNCSRNETGMQAGPMVERTTGESRLGAALWLLPEVIIVMQPRTI